MNDFTKQLKERKNQAMDSPEKKAADTFINTNTPVTSGPKQRVTIVLPWEMYETLKTQSTTTGKSMNTAVVEAIENYLS